MVNGKQTKSKCNKNWIYTNWFESIAKKNLSSSTKYYYYQPIKQVSESKTLGVIVDKHLKWKSNTEKKYVRK